MAGKTYVVSYVYDLADKVTKITYPSGRIVDVARDSTGRVGGITTKQNAAAASAVLASGVAYQPFGDLQSLTYGNGLSLWRTFTADDELNQLLVTNVPTGVSLIKRFHDRQDNGLNLTKIDAYDDVSPPPHQTFWYSPSRKLQNATGVWGDLTYYYGPGGNRTYEILTQGATTSTKVTNYEAASNRIAAVTTDGTTTRTFGHDNAGNVITDTRGSTVWSFTHNAAGRLSQASVGGSVRGAYTYDGMERLAIRAVTNTTPSGTTHLIYDTAGHLLAEANAVSGATIREYVWLEVEAQGADTGPTSRPANDNDDAGGQLGSAENDNDPTARAQLPSLNGPKRGIAPRAVPLAVVADVDTASPTTLFVHADHLDRPVRMTNASQTLVWDAVYKPYGEVASITGSASLDARFPGQWFQLETGLHYNWHRTYDPTTGRYLQPDPLGFVDGPSVYAYASSSPVMRTDDKGLAISDQMSPRSCGQTGFPKQLMSDSTLLFEEGSGASRVDERRGMGVLRAFPDREPDAGRAAAPGPSAGARRRAVCDAHGGAMA
jgi:RHS repeat-associated protein